MINAVHDALKETQNKYLNMTNKLGLPLEYKKLPEFFDAHNIGDDTDAKNSVIEKILKKHKIKTVLDLTCGTGSQVFFLAKHGYKIVGADFSSDLLKIARKKSQKRKIRFEVYRGRYAQHQS